jgi:glyoxylase-like metal-dependent hydrolase (beta-lactamase superfamily II)
MASLTLQQIAEHTYLIPAPTNIGVYVNDHQAILIDSGNDKEAGRQIFKLLTAQDWQLALIINTHSNADHIGGNAFLQNKTNCRIAATQMEAAFINHPILEPAFLFGGFPMSDLQNKFLVAQPSRVTDVIPASGAILETGLEAIALPGHYFEMIGIKTPDDVLFLADSVFSETILNKYHLVFLYDIQAQFETLERLKTLQAKYYVPSHGNLCTEIQSLAESNRRKSQEILAFIATCCAEPHIFEDILALICARYQIALNANQYVLVGSTVKSYLAYLLAQGKLTTRFTDGKMFWQRAM